MLSGERVSQIAGDAKASQEGSPWYAAGLVPPRGHRWALAAPLSTSESSRRQQ
jgi:hypothetical protein